MDLGEIERELKRFEEEERTRLGLDAKRASHWNDPNPREFAREQRATTTILFGGLTLVHDDLIGATLEGLGYRVEALDCPDNQALRMGKEFGNRGQCNPTYFTVGALIKHLTHLRDVDHVPVSDIVSTYVFLTAGACGPCRFGTYATEYRKALRDAGFDGFRVLLFQQMGGFKQATGSGTGLDLNFSFFARLVKGIVAGDVLNAMAYRVRPYEIRTGTTDQAVKRCRETLRDALRDNRSVLRALRSCRSTLQAVEVNRLQPKPKVMLIGEFWAMTTEGDGNYRLQRYLESEGAEVDVQMVTSWLLYMIWQARFDTRRRMDLRDADSGKKGLEDKNSRFALLRLWAAESALRVTAHAYARAVGLAHFHLPDMDEIARLARDSYPLELRGGEGHMEVGKLLDCVARDRAHMVVSVKPFGCMPSSGVSDGVQSAVVGRLPAALFCPVETTGDGAVNFQSRIQMFLFKARRRARDEFERALSQRQVDMETVRKRLRPSKLLATWYPRQSSGRNGCQYSA